MTIKGEIPPEKYPAILCAILHQHKGIDSFMEAHIAVDSPKNALKMS